MRRRDLLGLGLAVGAGALGAATARAEAAPLTVFAAASLTDVLKDLGAQWSARGGRAVRFSFAASSTLARQIEQGAPADLFASADLVWMDYLQKRGLIVEATRRSPIGNTLVLVGPKGADPVRLERGTDLASLLGRDGRLAVGDPAHVPAGIYAEQALRWMGAWDTVQPRLARAESVRAALMLVERDEAPLGIVYGTDAALDAALSVVGVFPEASHEPVAYPFAVVAASGAGPDAAGLLAFLTGVEAEATYRKYGFAILPRL